MTTYAQLDNNDQLPDGEPVNIHYNSRSFTYEDSGLIYTAPRDWMVSWTEQQKNDAHMWLMKTTYDGQESYDETMYRVAGDAFTYSFDGSVVTENQTLYQYSAGELPPPDSEASEVAFDIVSEGQVIWQQDRDRREVGATPIIADDDKPEFDQWMRDSFDAQDAGTIPPDPPASFRRAIDMPDQQEGQCAISWFEFTGGWPGWGFKALFKRDDIASLGLKVYDENGGYLYALTFVESSYHGEWETETPAGFATPTKVARSFEIIAGSAPVTEFLTLDDTKEYISFIVKWSSGTTP